MPSIYSRPRPLRYPVASVYGVGGPWHFRGELFARTIRFVDSEPLFMYRLSSIEFVLSALSDSFHRQLHLLFVIYHFKLFQRSSRLIIVSLLFSHSNDTVVVVRELTII